MIKRMKKILSLFMVICSVVGMHSYSFAATTAGQEMRTQVLYLADIITNDNFMNDFVTRAEFARMIVKASKFKDSVSYSDAVNAFSDVDNNSEYAPYIKLAAKRDI